ncbi:MAG: MaoC family dehydratase [Pseudomonadota bacterium]
MIRYGDWTVGETLALGHHVFERDEIIAFACKFDPQPFHLDAEAARQTPFGDLCASGWHTASIWMRLMIAWAQRHPDHDPSISFISPGIRDVRFPAPVLVGSRINYTTRIDDKRPMASRPGYGIITQETEARRDDGALTFAMTGIVFVPM